MAKFMFGLSVLGTVIAPIGVAAGIAEGNYLIAGLNLVFGILNYRNAVRIHSLAFPQGDEK